MAFGKKDSPLSAHNRQGSAQKENLDRMNRIREKAGLPPIDPLSNTDLKKQASDNYSTALDQVSEEGLLQNLRDMKAEMMGDTRTRPQDKQAKTPMNDPDAYIDGEKDIDGNSIFGGSSESSEASEEQE